MSLETKLDKQREDLRSLAAEQDALIAYANGVTGATDSRLGDAIRTLADGYGQGGGGVAEKGFEFEFTTDVALTANAASATLYDAVVPGIPAFDASRWFLLVVKRIDEDPGYKYNTGKVLVGRASAATLNAEGGTMLASDGSSFVYGSSKDYGINVKITSAGKVTVTARCYLNFGKILAGRYRVSVYYFNPLNI